MEKKIKKIKRKFSFISLTTLVLTGLFAFHQLEGKQVVETHAWSGTQTPNIGNYYQGLDSNLTGSAFKNSLKQVISAGNINQSYDWSRYEAADEAEGDANKVLLIYGRYNEDKSNHVSGAIGWNREHTYPQSKMGSPATSDNHIIFADDNKTNNARGNKKFADLNKSGTRVADMYGRSTDNYTNTTYFEPNDEAKPEVAWATMYAEVMYGYSITNNFNSLATALEWATSFPVTNRHIYRNNTVHQLQGNRNPFVDYPIYACQIWGDTNAETRSICENTYTPMPGLSLSPTAKTLAVDETLQLSVAYTGGLASGVTFVSSNPTVASVSASGLVSALASGNTTIVATSSVDPSISATTAITVTSSPIPPTPGTTYIETFDNMSISDSSYISGSHIGVNNQEWSYNEARGDLPLDGKAVTIRNNSLTTTFTNGLSSLAFDYKKQFTKTGAITVKLNGTTHEEITGLAQNDTGSVNIDNINLTGVVDLEINVTERITLDNIAWSEATTPTPQKGLTSIAVITPPTKTSYYVGELFDPTGLVVEATFSDGSTEIITPIYTLTPLSEGMTSVELTYTYEGVTKSVTTPINVNARSLVSLEIATLPTKTNYVLGESLDPAGLVVKATYNTGSPVSNYENYTLAPLTPFTSLGAQQISVTSIDNPSIAISFVVNVMEAPIVASGIYTITPATTSYVDASNNMDLLVSNLTIAKSNDQLGDLSITAASGMKLNSGGPSGSGVDGRNTINFGPLKNEGATLSITLPEHTYVIAVKLVNPQIEAATGKVSINNYSEHSITFGVNIEHTPFSNNLYINTAAFNNRVWVDAVEISVGSSEAAALEYGTRFLAATNDQCSAGNVSLATWTNLEQIFDNADESVKSIIKNTAPSLDGNDLTHALVRYNIIANKYGYNDFLQTGLVMASNQKTTLLTSSNIFIFITILVVSILIGAYLLAQIRRWINK